MKKIITLLFTLVCSQLSFSQSVKLIKFSGGYTFPLGVENCGDSRLFIVQKTGQIFISNSNGNRTITPFLSITQRVNATADESGLLGLAFDPNYASNGLFYVDYINLAGNTQISQFKVTADTSLADSNSEKKVMEITQPSLSHVGGCLRFGKDGFLYLGLGDGSNNPNTGDPSNNAQNPALLQGKMIRIAVNTDGTYSIPATNPFVNSATYRKEIWAVGLRNPWRFSFDALTGALMIADVGEALWEEVDVQKANSKGGENYGWRCYEGNYTYNDAACNPARTYTFPVYEYTHNGSPKANCAITGGFVYRGKKYPALYGKYFFTDFCSGVIRTLTLKDNKATKQDVVSSDIYYALTSFGEDAQHELYVVSSAGGTIYRVTSAL